MAIGIVLIVGVAISAFWSWMTIKLWKDPKQVEFFMISLSILPLGESGKRGEVRAAALTAVTLWGLVIGVIWSMIPSGGDHASGATTGRAIMFVIIALIVGPLLLEISVVLFNRPRFVVPPHMRSDAGALPEALAKRRAVRDLSRSSPRGAGSRVSREAPCRKRD